MVGLVKGKIAQMNYISEEVIRYESSVESDLDNEREDDFDEGGDVKQDDDDDNYSASGFQKNDVKRYLILEQNNARAINRLRLEVIYTKSPCDIVVSIKNKFDEIRCL